jgi:hypothetical protein
VKTWGFCWQTRVVEQAPWLNRDLRQDAHMCPHLAKAATYRVEERSLMSFLRLRYGRDRTSMSLTTPTLILIANDFDLSPSIWVEELLMALLPESF